MRLMTCRSSDNSSSQAHLLDQIRADVCPSSYDLVTALHWTLIDSVKISRVAVAGLCRSNN